MYHVCFQQINEVENHKDKHITCYEHTHIYALYWNYCSWQIRIDKSQLPKQAVENHQRIHIPNCCAQFMWNNNNSMVICILASETCIWIIMTRTMINDPWWFQTCLQATSYNKLCRLAPRPCAASRQTVWHYTFLHFRWAAVNGRQHMSAHSAPPINSMQPRCNQLRGPSKRAHFFLIARLDGHTRTHTRVFTFIWLLVSMYVNICVCVCVCVVYIVLKRFQRVDCYNWLRRTITAAAHHQTSTATLPPQLTGVFNRIYIRSTTIPFYKRVFRSLAMCGITSNALNNPLPPS